MTAASSPLQQTTRNLFQRDNVPRSHRTSLHSRKHTKHSPTWPRPPRARHQVSRLPWAAAMLLLSRDAGPDGPLGRAAPPHCQHHRLSVPAAMTSCSRCNHKTKLIGLMTSYRPPTYNARTGNGFTSLLLFYSCILYNATSVYLTSLKHRAVINGRYA